MSLLPGVPNLGPKPVTPSISPGIKAPSGFNAGAAAKTFGASDGKGSKAQSLGSPYTGPHATVTNGSPLARMMGHYGKTPPMGLGGIAGSSAPGSQTAHPGSSMVRGSAGVMRTHVREGGLGPGPMGAPGNSTDYSMNNPDPE